MGNTILTPSIIAKESLMQLKNNCVMANLVHRDYSKEFISKVGDTITIRKPATFEAKEFKQDKGIEIQDATQGSTTVTLDKHLDVSFEVTSKELSLEIGDFSQQFIVPAMQAFAQKIDEYLVGLYSDIINTAGAEKSPIGITEIINSRKELNKNGVPLSDRNFVVDPSSEADLLKLEAFYNASVIGDEGTALRDANMGRKWGYNFYMDQNIKTDTSIIQNLAFHKNAFALVTRPLALPNGVSSENAAIIDYDGFGLRVVYGYDITHKKDIVSIDVLCGVKTLERKMACKVLRNE